MLTIIKLADVNGEPKVKLDLPGPLRNGDPLALRFLLERQTGGRSEILEVSGRFQVTAVGIDASTSPPKQLLSVETVGRIPAWRSIKKRLHGPRRLGPARFPRTPV